MELFINSKIEVIFAQKILLQSLITLPKYHDSVNRLFYKNFQIHYYFVIILKSLFL